jgi:hypothetical protein
VPAAMRGPLMAPEASSSSGSRGPISDGMVEG